MKIATPWKKSPPSKKLRSCQAPPPFLKIWLEAQHPFPLQNGGGGVPQYEMLHTKCYQGFKVWIHD